MPFTNTQAQVPMPQETPVKMAVIQDGISLCVELHNALDSVGLFPALTGGLLYKTGPRKDIDIVLYRHRQQLAGGMPEMDNSDFTQALLKAGVVVTNHYGFVTKAKWNGFNVDLFNPESTGSGLYIG